MKGVEGGQQSCTLNEGGTASTYERTPVVDGIRIRPCRWDAAVDRRAVRVVHEAAFGRSDEADLVEGLYCNGDVLVSIVAEIDRRVVGHILFSSMSIVGPDDEEPAVALAPVAVLPGLQRCGIGSRLVRSGLRRLNAATRNVVLVLGDTDYYTRFGFSVQAASELESPFPAHAYMALSLNKGSARPLRGKVRYPDAFGLRAQ